MKDRYLRTKAEFLSDTIHETPDSCLPTSASRDPPRHSLALPSLTVTSMMATTQLLPFWLLLLVITSIHGFSTAPRSSGVWRSVCCSTLLRPSAMPIPKKEESSTTTRAAATTTTSSNAAAAAWHRERRRQMILKYGDKILPLERQSSSQRVALPLLLLTNALLLTLAKASGSLPIALVAALAIFPGSMLSLWQLQILHDVLHGSFFSKTRQKIWGVSKKRLQDATLFWGSMPSVFGYFLYLKRGHLTHHRNVGDPSRATLEQLFNSSEIDFEDGDVLFVAHRMKLKGDIGPRFTLGDKVIKMSISNSGFQSWKQGNAAWNACMFASSFLFERCMLVLNDVVVAIMGRNYFFPNKPSAFHDECTKYARCATLIRGLLLWWAGWKSLLFLYLSETLWSLPPHPASAMFVTNHGSTMDNDGNCLPTSSTYAGKWYSIFTLGTNYHTEHHDFPTIPLQKLGELRKIAPEYYKTASNDNLWAIMRKAFRYPDFYACMNDYSRVEE